MSYLFWAYSATWLVIFAYTLTLGARQKKLVRDVAWLKEAMEKQYPE